MFLRNHLRWWITLYGTGCLWLANNASCLPMNRDKDTVTATAENNGGEISVAKGKILLLKLDAQPGTGYSWQVTKNDVSHLIPLGHSEFESTNSGIPGAVQSQVFRFKPQDSGRFVIELHYQRQWEKNVPPSKTYRLAVQVQ
jgi:inhibitor of cysteine peptidase